MVWCRVNWKKIRSRSKEEFHLTCNLEVTLATTIPFNIMMKPRIRNPTTDDAPTISHRNQIQKGTKIATSHKRFTYAAPSSIFWTSTDIRFKTSPNDVAFLDVVDNVKH